MGLNGIDISSWQDDLVVSNMGTCDFVIVKATGGAGYSNECFRRHADETLAAGKLLGWSPQIELPQGLRLTREWIEKNPQLV